MAIRTKTGGLLLGLAMAVTAAGCGPNVSAFAAKPNVICSGSQTRLSWDATKGGTLTASPPTSGTGSVESQGSVMVAPTTTTRFHLEVSSLFGQDGRDVDVSVLAASDAPKPIGRSVADPSASCDGSGVSVTAVAPLEFWDPKLRVGHVVSQDGRRYHIEHAGRSGDVAPGAPSDAFQGTDVSGEWKLKTPLESDEACGKKLPRSLMVGVAAACSP